MGVDASYVYGYGIEVDKVEIDIELLKEKYKHRLHERITDKYTWSRTWEDLISDLEESIENEWDLQEDIESYANSELFRFKYGENENYMMFDHEHLVKAYPDAQLKEWDNLVLEYARDLGIKNYKEIGWIEYGFFD